MAKRILPPTYFFASLCLMLGLYFLLPLTHVAPSPWRWLSILPIGIGVWLNLAADRAKIFSSGASRKTAEPSRLKSAHFSLLRAEYDGNKRAPGMKRGL